MNRYFIIGIQHSNTADRTFTFRSTAKLAIGEIAICHTRKGYRLGKVVSVRKAASVEEAQAYTGIVARATAYRQEKLSAYDRATLIYKTTGDEERALRCFNPYKSHDERRALTAFLYNETDASRVCIHTDVFGCGNVIVEVFDFAPADSEDIDIFRTEYVF